MPQRVRCPCGGKPECRLCRGTRAYEYEPGPRGWMPFPCPTCGGTGRRPGADGQPVACLTCRGEARVDPANPPTKGLWDVLWKIAFGA